MKKRIVKCITLSLTACTCSLIAMNSCKATDVSGSSLEVSNETSVESTVKASKPSIKGKMTIAKGKIKKLKVKNVSGLKIKWRTKNKSIAKVVMKKGVPYVKACKVGKTVIRAKVDGKTLKCRVKVKKNSTPKKNNNNTKNSNKSSNNTKNKQVNSNKKVNSMLEGIDVFDGGDTGTKKALDKEVKNMTAEGKAMGRRLTTG